MSLFLQLWSLKLSGISLHDWGERFSLCKILPIGALQKWTCVQCHQNVKCLWTSLETWHNVLTQIIEMEVKSNVSITLNNFIFVSQHTALSCHTAVYNSLSISTVAVSLCFDNKWRLLCFKKDQWNKKLSVWRPAAKKHILTLLSVSKRQQTQKGLWHGWLDGWPNSNHNNKKLHFFIEFEVWGFLLSHLLSAQ